MIRLKCPHCNKVLMIDEQFALKTGTCTDCGGRITVPIPLDEGKSELSDAQPPPVPRAVAPRAWRQYDWRIWLVLGTIAGGILFGLYSFSDIVRTVSKEPENAEPNVFQPEPVFQGVMNTATLAVAVALVGIMFGIWYLASTHRRGSRGKGRAQKTVGQPITLAADSPPSLSSRAPRNSAPPGETLAKVAVSGGIAVLVWVILLVLLIPVLTIAGLLFFLWLWSNV